MEQGIDLQRTLESYFQWFHKYPELGNHEYKTTARIKELLAQAGVEILESNLATGCIACIRGGTTGPVIALRSDIDALPIVEATNLAYTSKNSGCMHACGHDFHLTALLGAAKLLNARKEQLCGTIKLVFQPSEEVAGGARDVLASGLLDDVQEIYGLHVAAELAPDTVAVCVGADHAAVGIFSIDIKGKGGHAALPHLCIDPITALAQLVTSVQNIVSRSIDPFDQVVISITHVESGSAWNVIPSDAILEGTIRVLSKHALETVTRRMEQVCAGVAQSTDTDISFNLKMTSPATDNHPKLVTFVEQTANELGLRVTPCTPTMTGEDFALYQQRIPGTFWHIGVNSPQPLHHPGFIADTASLSGASKLLAELGEKALLRLIIE